ncbi:hypothetical protein SERLA73DRAFT_179870 [Serpula lacrymans var. lacrymans S7.3]|uniref:Uncharacterized protein n=2 Tax=Serpula lacrymans var. lacrymans TaxID=341189 RepID=F8PUV4_SERL3|nr:uncharacterized protein SERLADRAFT_465180 [Serpula lacrymans var. lacrymans S7.9]EGN99718.1 hypothetical protein SERLA73DRAFT_179870 [Serpula lacrymans var. lacrymans S7.3]EGO25283.1 hypothetical protein SERLADRAFT_465180 [Serpula lacrymans var. lacrymans S7.9]
MSDTGRQSLTDKASSAVKPDSQKSMTEQAGDKVKGYADSAASTVQPQGDKSTSQQAGDTFSSNSNQNQGGLLDKAKEAVGMGGNQPQQNK